MTQWASSRVHKSRIALISFFLTLTTLIGTSWVPSVAAPTVKIAVIYDIGGRGDGGINDAAALGVDKAKKKFGLGPLALREIATDGTDLDRLLKIRFLANAGYSPILLVGYGFQSSLAVAMNEFPSTEFAIIDNSNVGQLNVECMVFNEAQSSYLAGVLAASASKSGKIALLLDVDRTNLRDLNRAFLLGAQSIKPKIQVLAQNWGVSPSSDAASMAQRGADVFYSTWNQSSDVMDAIVARTTKSKPLRYIGVLPDQFFLRSTKAKSVLLGAVQKRVDVATYDVISYGLSHRSFLDALDSENGIFGREYSFKDGGVDLLVPALGSKYVAAVLRAEALIKSGRVNL
jgi:basic membrane protein A